MADYKKNEVIIAELEALNVAHNDDMTNKELQALLDDTTDAPEAQAKEVNLGVATINDHEKRIFALEQIASELEKLVDVLMADD